MEWQSEMGGHIGCGLNTNIYNEVSHHHHFQNRQSHPSRKERVGQVWRWRESRAERRCQVTRNTNGTDITNTISLKGWENGVMERKTG